jgi:hypothetical protein
MSMIQPSLFPEIPQFYAQNYNREVMPMSDYVHTSRRSKASVERGSIEWRLMYVACYVLFLLWAVAMRLLPWRRPADADRSRHRESIFAEARSEAGRIVTFSFMGL